MSYPAGEAGEAGEAQRMSLFDSVEDQDSEARLAETPCASRSRSRSRCRPGPPLFTPRVDHECYGTSTVRAACGLRQEEGMLNLKRRPNETRILQACIATLLTVLQ